MKFTPAMKAWLVDVAERAGSTFAETFLGVFGIQGLIALTGGNWHATATLARSGEVAALGAALAVVKGAVAARKNGTVSPASVAPAQQPGQAGRTAHAHGQRNRRSAAAYNPSVHDHLALLPAPAGRKGGALPSPRDDRDYQAKLPTKIPASVDNGAGITWGMLLNDRIGDCYPAAFLHALQVLAPTGFFPSDADALAVYEQVTGYDPARTDARGNNPTDQGTYGRQLFDWARRQGLIASYAAVLPTTAAVKAAIAGHKAVLCEWALPVGAETEGDVWTMPRSGRTPGSWGGHATVEVGYTPTRNRNVTWGEQGTVTAAFENAYLQAAWVIEVPPGVNVAAIMAKVRTA